MAVSSGKPSYRSDIENDPGMSPEEKEVARARGYRSLLVVPMLRDGVSIGTLAVSRPEAGRSPTTRSTCSRLSPTRP